MAFPKVKISDDSGNTVGVDNSSNALNVKLVDSDNIDIGNVVLTNASGNDIYTAQANTDANPDLDGQRLLCTHALLSARTDSSTTVGLTCEDSTHNALHVAISDGAGIAHVDGNNNLNTILADNSGVDIGDVDVTSIVPGTGATNLGKAEDTAHSSGDVGVATLAVRKDTMASLSSHTGDYTPLQVSEDGGLWVSLDVTTGNSKYFNVASTAASSSQYGSIPLIKMNDAVAAPSGHVDNDWTYFQTNIKGALYTTGGEVEDSAVQSQPSLIGGRYDLSPRALNDGDAGAVAITAKGEVIVNLPSGQQTWVAREDSAHSNADYGVPAMTVRNDVLASLASDDGDYQPLQVDAQGALYTTHGMTGVTQGVNNAVSNSTAEVLRSSLACKRVDMMSSPDNTGYIWVGSSDALENDGSVGGIRLAPGDFYSIDVNNAADIFVISTVDGEDIMFNLYT